MSRGGINRAQVARAREAVCARNEYPSIDAVRIELGNTGSKTTIHRHLKELEAEEGANPLRDDALLSDTLTEMIQRLAGRLQEEAAAEIARLEDKHRQCTENWKTADDQHRRALQEAETRSAALSDQLAAAQKAGAQLERDQRALLLTSERVTQRAEDLEGQLAESKNHMASLEDKHRHAREAMQHYRKSVVEQREQDIRRHEQQLQLLQAEQRQLRQTLAVSSNEIVQYKADHASLTTALAQQERQTAVERARAEQLQEQLTTVARSASKLTEQLSAAAHRQREQTEMASLWQRRAQDADTEKRQLELTLAGLSAELAIKNQLLQKVQLKPRAQTSDPDALTDAAD